MRIVLASRRDRERSVAGIRGAIAAANRRAGERRPDDPSWCTEGDVTPSAVLAELAKGTMEPVEVRAWLLDLESALREAGVACRVEPSPRNTRVLNADSWHVQLPAQPSAFLFFAPEWTEGFNDSLIGRDVRNEMARPITDWARFPNSTCEVSSGLSTFVCADHEIVDAFLVAASSSPQAGIRCYTRAPRRMRLAELTYGARMRMQVCDETAAPATSLEAVLFGLRVVAAHAFYAYVRPGLAAAPHEFDTYQALGRPPTSAELFGDDQRAADLLSEFAIDAYVAQVVTDSHLEKAHDLSEFDIQTIAPGRHLVMAKDPSPWLDPDCPTQSHLDRARAGFGDMLLTPETIDRHRRRPGT
jgi:hypothetical protein